VIDSSYDRNAHPRTASPLFHCMLELEAITRLCGIGKRSLDEELNALHRTMDKDVEKLDERSLEAYLSDINDDYIVVSETLPVYQWYALYVLAYGLFEKALSEECETLRVDRNLSLSAKDLNGQGLVRFKTYLVKVAGVTDPFKDQLWQAILHFAEVRNAIVHRAGFVDFKPNDQSSLYARLSAKGDVAELKQEVQNQEDAQIIISEQYVLSSVETYSAFLRQLQGVAHSVRRST